MNKKAILFYGSPLKGENVLRFRKFVKRDLSIIEDLLLKKDYSVSRHHLDDLTPLKKLPSNTDLFFYYTGHANDGFFEGYSLNDVFEKVKHIKGFKTFVLDACAGGDYVKDVHLPNKSKIITANNVSGYKSLAMILWDSLVALNNSDLRSIDESVFREMKHNEVYVRGNF